MAAHEGSSTNILLAKIESDTIRLMMKAQRNHYTAETNGHIPRTLDPERDLIDKKLPKELLLR